MPGDDFKVFIALSSCDAIAAWVASEAYAGGWYCGGLIAATVLVAVTDWARAFEESSWL